MPFGIPAEDFHGGFGLPDNTEQPSQKWHGTCPVCGSILTHYPSETISGSVDFVFLPAECMECGATWQQQYVFVRNVRIETNEE